MDSERRSRVYKIVILYFILVFSAMMWPIYPFFSRIRPMVLGIPFSLFYLVILIIASFLVLFTLYLWECRNDGIE